VIGELKEAIQEKHATIDITELGAANVIVFQFRQLMHNLISNALKFSIPDIPPHIIIKSRLVRGSKLNNENLLPKKNYCHISVSDNGIGFDPQYRERIFEVFQRLHGKNKYNGTGIGLAIVKKIVENHNGIVTATSELKHGASFDIYIPAA
jgi:two-component system CheB/CheR fusion protein